MFKAQIENSGGEVLTLTQNEPKWQVLSIGGLNPPQAQVNTTAIAGMDGSKFNSSKLGMRNIVIMLRINGNVEENRQTLYRFFRTKEISQFYFTNQNREVSIPGYVETVECNLFSNSEVMQVSIICPYPYFRALADLHVDISNEHAAFYFPFAINEDEPVPFSLYVENRITNVPNNSEAEVGVLIDINVLADVNEIMIKDTDTGDEMTLAYEFLESDRILINTIKGEKSITLWRGGALYNIFTAMQKGSVFFQLKVGDNHFGYSVDDGDKDDKVKIIMTYHHLYRGV